MRKWILFLLFGLLGTAQAATPVSLVSGFDDVLRQAENHSLWRAGLKLFEKDQTFAGMPELYSGILEKTEHPQFFLVSATSSMFRGRITKFIGEAGFPQASLYLRSWLTQWSIENFKGQSIREILGGDTNRKLVIIFDNSGPSLEMAKGLPALFPNQVAAFYLHEIVERPATEGARSYVTAFDIAVAELAEGRLSKTGIEKVADAVLAEKDPERVIPHYAYCPKSYDPCRAWAPAPSKRCDEIRDRVRAICANR